MGKKGTISHNGPANAGGDTPAWGWLLAVWMALVVVLNGVAWTTGVIDYDLAAAVENGAARVEERAKGEESEDVTRKEIQLQRDTLPFWTVITAIGDFLIAPLTLAVRALVVAVSLSAVAAMTGRPVRFPVAMAQCVAWQGVWVLGLAVQVTFMLVLNRPHIDTSLLLLMPDASFTARQYVALRQVDFFVIIGWLSLAWSGCRRGQSNLLVALIVCGVLAMSEASVWSSASLAINLSMRLTLFGQ